MFMTVKIKKAALWGAAILALLAAVLFGRQLSKPAMSGNTRTLVIDPGHGGIDGGAVAADGTKESAINLAVGLRMRAIAGLYGVDAVMTRETEESGVSVSEYSEHGDLVRRAELANSVPGAVLVSVHQNNFPTAQPSGAQVLYAASGGSRELGLLAQSALVGFADPGNRRVAEPAPEKLLLTSSVGCPAILAECGFMSNPGEAAKLKTPEYQTKLACALTAAYLQFAGGASPA